MPEEYVRLRLCRDVYHCLPSQLEGEDWETVQEDLAMVAAEGKWRKAEARSARARAKL